MKIVADENIPLVEEFFNQVGEVVRLPGRQMHARDLRDADVLLVRSVTRVNAELLGQSPVRFVGTCTIGLDHLDQDFLRLRDISYSTAPGCNATSVVEYVYAALCHLNVNWLPLKVGIIGCGNVGGLLHRRLREQGVSCYCYDPFLTDEQNFDLADLEEVLSCDVISLHTPLTTSGPYPTHHLLGKNELQQLKPGAVLLNCGRGPVIDNQALLAILEKRTDLQVVLDVWEPEPNISLPLLQKVRIGTPHIAGYSYDGKLRGTEMIYQALCHHLDVPARKTLVDLVPPLANNTLMTSGLDTWSEVKNIIAQVYDIAADDLRLRELSARAVAGTADFAQGFDLLRKHYPLRREFFNYYIHHRQNELPLMTWLATLGFNLV